MSDYESRLDQELQAIMRSQRTAALGTLAEDGSPWVSLATYAVEPRTHSLVLQLAAAAPHTAHLRRDPRTSLLIPALEGADDASRARLTLTGDAEFPAPGSELWQACRLAWLARFPETESMASMLDLTLVAVTPRQIRQVSGFGAARSIEGPALEPLLAA